MFYFIDIIGLVFEWMYIMDIGEWRDLGSMKNKYSCIEFCGFMI